MQSSIIYDLISYKKRKKFSNWRMKTSALPIHKKKKMRRKKKRIVERKERNDEFIENFKDFFLDFGLGFGLNAVWDIWDHCQHFDRSLCP